MGQLFRRRAFIRDLPKFETPKRNKTPNAIEDADTASRLNQMFAQVQQSARPVLESTNIDVESEKKQT